jgi:hypothetical protein
MTMQPWRAWTLPLRYWKFKSDLSFVRLEPDWYCTPVGDAPPGLEKKRKYQMTSNMEKLARKASRLQPRSQLALNLLGKMGLKLLSSRFLPNHTAITQHPPPTTHHPEVPSSAPTPDPWSKNDK